MWKRGQWLAVCDVCGLQYHSGKLRKRWDGLMVCQDDYETRHPQEFIRPVLESTIPWARRPQEVNISENDYCDSLYVSPSDATNMPGEYMNRLGT